MKKFKKAMIFISVIYLVFCIISGVLGIISSFSSDYSTDFFGPLLNILLFYFGVVLIIRGFIIVGLLWLFYFLLTKALAVYSKSNNKTPLIIIAIGFILIITGFLLSSFNSANYNSSVLEPDYYGDYSTVIDKDTIYQFNSSSNNLYSMKINGSNKKKLLSFDETGYKQLYLHHNDLILYYDSYNEINKAYNTTTKEITDLDEYYIYMPYTLVNNTISAAIDNAVVDNCFFSYKQLDLNTLKTLKEVKISCDDTWSNEHFVDYEEGIIYTVKEITRDKEFALYKDNKFLANIPYGNKIMMLSDDYFYIYSDSKFYLYDRNTYEFVKDIESISTEYDRLYSADRNVNYFNIDDKLYEFDFKTNQFNLVLDNLDSYLDIVYKRNNKLVFAQSEYQNYTVVYDLKTKKYDTYKTNKYYIDDDYLYLSIVDGNKLEKIKL